MVEGDILRIPQGILFWGLGFRVGALRVYWVNRIWGLGLWVSSGSGL